jgi:hypothetical protein
MTSYNYTMLHLSFLDGWHVSSPDTVILYVYNPTMLHLSTLNRLLCGMSEAQTLQSHNAALVRPGRMACQEPRQYDNLKSHIATLLYPSRTDGMSEAQRL